MGVVTQVKKEKIKISSFDILFSLQTIALYYAARNGYVDVVSLLLKHPQIDPNAKDKGDYTGKKIGMM